MLGSESELRTTGKTPQRQVFVLSGRAAKSIYENWLVSEEGGVNESLAPTRQPDDLIHFYPFHPILCVEGQTK